MISYNMKSVSQSVSQWNGSLLEHGHSFLKRDTAILDIRVDFFF